jgi:hypothetical protein
VVLSMNYPDAIYEAMAEMLMECYRSIDWCKAGQKSAYDYFAVRIQSAGITCKTVPSALNHLAKRCNVAAFDMDTDLVSKLIENEKQVLWRMAHESAYIALLAATLAKERRKKK